MNEEQDVLRLQQSLRGLDAAYEQLQNMDLPIDLTMPDGSVNYMAVLRVLRDEEFQGFREQNPEAFGSLRNNFSIRMATSGIQTANDLAKLGFSLSQIKRANSINDRMPSRMRTPEGDQRLDQEISDLQQDIAQGLSQTERNIAERQDDLQYQSDLQRAQQFSGGQAASAQAAAAAASRRRADNSLRRTALSAQIRGQNRDRLRQLLSLRQREIDRGLRVDQFNAQQDMQRFRIVNKAKNDLMQAGYTNAFRAGDALFQDMDEAIGLFQDQMPGFIRRDNLTNDPGTPFNNIFNSPIRTMATGASLLGGSAASSAVQAGYGQMMNGITDQAISPLDPQNMYL